MPIFTIRHETIYRYRRAVAFGEHRMMLRPRSDEDQRVLDYRLDVKPSPAALHEDRDRFGNAVTIARFDRGTRAQELRFLATVTVDQATARIPVLAAPVPAPAAEIAARSSLDDWAALFRGHAGQLATAIAMTKAIDRGYRHIPRHEKGVQDPAETLALGCGTCRDFAVLMISALARHGIPARFVSGYLHLPNDPPDRMSGGNTHAWVQADVDGRTIDFDPSHGTIGNAGLIRVAVVDRPADAVPLAGSWFGSAADAVAMDVSVKVRAEHAEAA